MLLIFIQTIYELKIRLFVVARFFWQVFFPMSNYRNNGLVYVRLMEILLYILCMYSFYNKFCLFEKLIHKIG